MTLHADRQEHSDPITVREDLRKTIQVPLIDVQAVPSLGGTIPATRSASADKSWYGTRLVTVILVRRDGEVLFVERDIYKLGPDGQPIKASLEDSQTRVFMENAGNADRIHRFRLPPLES